MKFAMFLLLPLVLLVSCKHAVVPDDEIHYSDPVAGFSIFTPATTFSSFSDAAKYVSQNVTHEANTIADDWQSPEVTWSTGKGDSVDCAILFMDLVYVTTGQKFSLVLVSGSDTQTGLPPWVRALVPWDHALVKSPEGVLVDPVTGCSVTSTSYRTYSFDYCLK